MTFQPRVWFVWVRERKEKGSVVGINVHVGARTRSHTPATRSTALWARGKRCVRLAVSWVRSSQSPRGHVCVGV